MNHIQKVKELKKDFNKKFEILKIIKKDIKGYWTVEKDGKPYGKEFIYKVAQQEAWNWIEQALIQERQETIESVNLPKYDHSKCPMPQSCIGYMNAESDLENIKLELLGQLKQNK